MLTTYDKSDRFRLTNTLLDILHRLYVIKLLSTVGTQWVILMYRILEESGLGLIADLSCHLSNKKCHFCNHLILITSHLCHIERER